MSRRAFRRYPELTSLLDVLMIIVFASLIGARRAPAETPLPAAPAPPAPAPQPAPTVFDDTAATRLVASIQNQDVILVTVSQAGYIVALSRRVEQRALAPTDMKLRLLKDSPDPAEGVEYWGRSEREHRVCYVVRRELDMRPDLARALVVITTARPFAVLPYALVQGLKRDVASCLDDANGYAILVDPGKVERSAVQP
jgi:hypothetical protein